MIAAQSQPSIRGILWLIASLWVVYLLDGLLPINFTDWGIVPRRLTGLMGIPLSVWLHGSLGHLISNTIPLLILLLLFVHSRRTPWIRIAEIIVCSGVLLWVFGRNGSGQQVIVHVGASGLIYGLIAYLIVVGFREKHPVSLLISVVVGFLYGGSLLWGVLPTAGGVSWDGHLAGAVAGAILALLFPVEDGTEAAQRVEVES
ncbi:MAG: rhomboid family intramembrane serine protease [Pirellulaceae bacterium]|nr:rhomboid family intramembrane serine protease [Pirellulaceae bacterium]